MINLQIMKIKKLSYLHKHLPVKQLHFDTSLKEVIDTLHTLHVDGDELLLRASQRQKRWLLDCQTLAVQGLEGLC